MWPTNTDNPCYVLLLPLTLQQQSPLHLADNSANIAAECPLPGQQ